MTFRCIVPAFAGCLVAATVFAQTAPNDPPAPHQPVLAETPVQSEASARTETPAPAEDEKSYLIDPSGPIAGCAIKPYLRCLKRDQAQCETATRTAAEQANAEIEIDAAKRSAEERDSPFFEGVAIGIFLRHMDRQMDGRFIECMHEAK